MANIKETFHSSILDVPNWKQNTYFFFLFTFFSQVLQQVRELIQQCDQTMKAVTVSYFHLQYTLTSPVPTQFQVSVIFCCEV